MEFKGKIVAVLAPRGGVSKAGNPWSAQEYVIESNEQYARKMCFEVFGDEKIRQFNIQMGEELIVSFDIDARQWNERWFNSIRAWKVERVVAQQPQQPQGPIMPQAAGLAMPPMPAPDPADDLPF